MWKSKTQHVVACSNVKAKYMAMVHGCVESYGSKNLTVLDFHVIPPPKMYCNNKQRKIYQRILFYMREQNILKAFFFS